MYLNNRRKLQNSYYRYTRFLVLEFSKLGSLMTETSLVSVIMPNLNKGRYMKHALESVLLQSHSNPELIVVDGGSSDESLSVIEEMQQ